ncbi:Pyruvate,phosphate dikinase [Candidatus Nitrosotalea sp. TS]|uniref:putative PEP-binding protein n=1 Tax=Candidatus Nitrosotalea sp. TS TaxID=2341020 RepID=UPI001EC9352B|nr:putative PEP-binding protein [Candidatus Nitrosotalea sp. TS]NHI02487.1 Pyruvate,phosphate dikinase [Candidatus Nitrosotalea sp. TS]
MCTQADIPTVEPKLTDDFRTILEWSEKFKTLGIRANADTPEAAKLARSYGAKGIGLCRTERMFNARDRLDSLCRDDNDKDYTRKKSSIGEASHITKT